MIRTSDLIGKFQKALDEKWGYIWGTAGTEWTAAKQKQIEQTTDSDRANSRKYGSKWIGHMVADCSGMFAWSFKQLGGKIAHGSNSIWNSYCSSKGQLKNGKRTDGKELKPGTAIFTYNKEKKNRGHIGLYIGNGYIIEAKGAYYGVCKSKITESRWVEWGELKNVDYGGDSQPSTGNTTDNDDTGFPINTGWRPTVRKGNKGDVVRECQTILNRLGYNLGICGIDGDFGVATEKAVMEFQRDHKLIVDGICGPMTWDALQKVNEQLNKKSEDLVYSVTISNLDLTQAQAIAANYPGAVITERSSSK